MNEIWMKREGEKINFNVYDKKEDIFEVQRNSPSMIYIALLFDNDPIKNQSIRLCIYFLFNTFHQAPAFDYSFYIILL